MADKIIKILIIAALILISAFFVLKERQTQITVNKESPTLEFATTTFQIILPPAVQKIATPTPQKPLMPKTSSGAPTKNPPLPAALPPAVVEVSSKSFEELINSSVLQIYCGELGEGGTTFTRISRGSAIVISDSGDVLTSRHIIYDESFNKERGDCFALKSPFPNLKSEKPKIYYTLKIIDYPETGKYSKTFSDTKYYNDFALLKIGPRPDENSKINILLQTDYASEADYAVLSPYVRSPEGGENNGKFNFLPIDWNYRPADGDPLITLGYGVDAAHIANQITSTIGRLSGNVSINGDSEFQIFLIESDASQGFSGGALINSRSKGLIGLISWVANGGAEKKFTAAIFRDFLQDMMLKEINFDLKSLLDK